MKNKINLDEYIKNLERALIFMCESYMASKDMIASCREDDNHEANEKYSDLWFNFPMIQGSQNLFAIQNIAELRTKLHNREANTMSFKQIFEQMHIGRKTKRELQDEMRETVSKSLKKEDK